DRGGGPHLRVGRHHAHARQVEALQVIDHGDADVPPRVPAPPARAEARRVERSAGGDEAPRQDPACEGLMDAPRGPILPRIARAAFPAGGRAPCLIPLLRAWLPLGAIGVALDAIFIPMCHRMPERT